MLPGDLGPLKASSSVPIACRAFRWRGRRYFDGGLSDPIPVERTLAAGCDCVVAVLTRPKGFRRDPAKDWAASLLLRPRYPRVAELLVNRAGTYDCQLD